MKRSKLFIAALAALIMAGCTLPGGPDWSGTYPFTVETTEDDGTDIYVTKYEHDTLGNITKETKTKNGMPWQETNDFKEDYSTGYIVRTGTRIIYNPDGTNSIYELTSTYGDYYDNVPLETQYEVTDKNTGAVIEARETEYEGRRVVGYTATYADGTVVQRTNYRYNDTSSSEPKWTYLESRPGSSTPPTRYGIKVNRHDYQGNVFEYEMRKNVSDEQLWDGTGGVLVEEKVDYDSEELETSWKIKKYDDEGNLISTTDVVNKMEYKTITLTSQR